MAVPPTPARVPIVIEPHDPGRDALARDTCRRLEAVLHRLGISSLEHVGATAVVGLAARPVVDFAARIPALADADTRLGPALEAIGWLRERLPDADRRRFALVVDGREVARLDVFDERTPQWIRQKRFRDALRANSALAREYTVLRLALADRCADDPEAYVRGKSEFVERALVAPNVVRSQRCPVCRLPTLDGRGDFEICGECGWEDDGQDDADADDVRGGPNGPLSLATARVNYARTGASDAHLVPERQ